MNTPCFLCNINKPSYMKLNCNHEICLTCSSKLLKFNDDWYMECSCSITTSIDLHNRPIDNQTPSYQAAASCIYDADKYNKNYSLSHPACAAQLRNINTMFFGKDVISSKRNSVLKSIKKVGCQVTLVPQNTHEIDDENFDADDGEL
ncbi:unnamed protein product [Adineta steineri]|uniref:Uncharacterized protein n=1 Tax=Adineta steineri TaxID=433720 RepID=A0A818XCF5_9BILA|nr:unnamed protein product [Adineta steineri]CAF3737330.1 unnamed protein product [Adineta steineri]